MMKRVVVFWIMILSLGSLNAFEVQTSRIHPNQITLSWERAANAQSYEIYLNDRYQGTVSTPSYTVQYLVSHTSYTIDIVAKRGVSTIDRGRVNATTPGWEGRYRWINETRRDNRGRATTLDYRVEYVLGEYVIYGLYEGLWHEVFPLVGPFQIGVDFEYQGDRPQEIAYRYNARIFNASAINPKYWKVLETQKGDDELIIKMETRVGALRYTTLSRYHFTLDSEGNRVLEFSTHEEGINNWAVFSSPNPGEEGVFIARAIR